MKITHACSGVRRYSLAMSDLEGLPRPVEGKRLRGAGGTPGGIGSFFVGLGLTMLGGYLVFNQVTVHTNFQIWGWPGSAGSGFGVVLFTVLLGVGILFFNAKNILGWVLTVGGMGVMIASIILNLNVFFRPTTLLMTLFMFGSLAAGLGLVFRSFRSMP
jgi:hypothetical protein